MLPDGLVPVLLDGSDDPLVRNFVFRPVLIPLVVSRSWTYLFMVCAEDFGNLAVAEAAQLELENLWNVGVSHGYRAAEDVL